MEDKNIQPISQQGQTGERPELPHLSTEPTMIDGFMDLLKNGGLSDEGGQSENIQPAELDMNSRLGKVEQSLSDALTLIRELKNAQPSSPQQEQSEIANLPEPQTEDSQEAIASVQPGVAEESSQAQNMSETPIEDLSIQPNQETLQDATVVSSTPISEESLTPKEETQIQVPEQNSVSEPVEATTQTPSYEKSNASESIQFKQPSIETLPQSQPTSSPETFPTFQESEQQSQQNSLQTPVEPIIANPVVESITNQNDVPPQIDKPSWQTRVRHALNIRT